MLRQSALEYKLLSNIVNAKIKPGKGVIGNLRQIDADALVHTLEMRRGVEAGAHAGGSQNRGQRGCRRSLAVGPGHEHSANMALRIAQRGQQDAHLVEREFSPWLAGARIQLRRHGIQFIDGC